MSPTGCQRGDPTTLLALANAARGRRGETRVREPFDDTVSTRRTLASAGIEVDAVPAGELPDLRVLAAENARLADDIAHDRPSPRRPRVSLTGWPAHRLGPGTVGHRRWAFRHDADIARRPPRRAAGPPGRRELDRAPQTLAIGRRFGADSCGRVLARLARHIVSCRARSSWSLLSSRCSFPLSRPAEGCGRAAL